MGNGFRIDLDGFSARKIEYGSILKDFYNFGLFGSSPAGPNWVLTQVGLGSARLKPKLTWDLPSQSPIDLGFGRPLGFWPGKSQVNLSFSRADPKSTWVKTQVGPAGLLPKSPKS